MKLAVLGAGGHGKVVADAAEASGWDTIEFFDDSWPASEACGVWPVVGDGEALLRRVSDYDGVVVAIGNNRIRHEKICELRKAGASLPALIHPAATVSRYASVSEGTVVFAGAVINVNATIKSGCIINTGCSVDHDCELGEAVHISPGARLAGDVRVGDWSWIGIGASIRQSARIGERVMVGAGAVVTGDVQSGITVVGVPAKQLG